MVFLLRFVVSNLVDQSLTNIDINNCFHIRLQWYDFIQFRPITKEWAIVCVCVHYMCMLIGQIRHLLLRGWLKMLSL